ncbi:metallophosphoesterase family protein [Furfurilactobacillus cerevisiae]|uniref:metallophosphoesterase family protein n=1 Tax=Furfurilactobacillus rossiae TaxID=231049 RepID=UPI003B97DB10
MDYRIAVLSDSHGNASALSVALSDAKKHGVDEVWSLGDIALGGATSAECYDLLEQVGATQYLMGNWESDYNFIMGKPKKGVNFDDPTDVYFTILAQYEHARYTPQREAQLRNLPMTGRKVLDNLVFTMSHNLPTKNHGHSLFPTETQANFDVLTENNPAADVALYAHTHTPVWRYTSNGQMVLNPGSIGQIWFTRDKLLANRAASYLLLTISEKGIEDVDFRRVPYDMDGELQRAKDLHFPYVDLYQKLMFTGHASTHDAATLTKVNAEHHYREQAIEFLNSLPTPESQDNADDMPGKGDH